MSFPSQKWTFPIAIEETRCGGPVPSFRVKPGGFPGCPGLRESPLALPEKWPAHPSGFGDLKKRWKIF